MKLAIALIIVFFSLSCAPTTQRLTNEYIFCDGQKEYLIIEYPKEYKKEDIKIFESESKDKDKRVSAICEIKPIVLEPVK